MWRSIHHIEVKDLDTKAIVVLVKDSFEVIVEHVGTFAESGPSPMVQRTSLKLNTSLVVPVIVVTRLTSANA